MSTYICIAYRWGSTNEHQYILYAGRDLEKATDVAENEPCYRGGKYGAGVYVYTEHDGEGGVKLLHYYPSLCGEKQPTHNWQIDAFLRLGHFANDAADGEIMVPVDDPADCILQRRPVECPEWLKAGRDRAMKFATDMHSIEDARAAG